MVGREVLAIDFHAPIRDRSGLPRHILRRTRLRSTPGSPDGPSRAWAVQPPGTSSFRSFPVEDHFRRWYHPGRRRCPGGDQQPPRPRAPDHFIAPAAWRRTSRYELHTCGGGLQSAAPQPTTAIGENSIKRAVRNGRKSRRADGPGHLRRHRVPAEATAHICQAVLDGDMAVI